MFLHGKMQCHYLEIVIL